MTMLRARAGWPAWVVPVAIALLGIGWRIAWLVLNPDKMVVPGEAPNVAIAYAQTGVFADPYGPGTGPTAHVNPVLPFVNALVYRVFGIETALSLWLLSLMSVAMTAAIGLVSYAAFRAISMARPAALAALTLYFLLPLNPSLEAASFRIWEGGLAVLLWAVLILLVARSDDLPTVSVARLAALGFLAAFLFFVSPPLGLAGYAAVGILLLRRIAWRRWAGAAATVAVGFAVVIGGWTWRNSRQLGEPVPLRSNFGLEFALSNNPLAAATGDTGESFERSFKALHPINNPANFAQVKRIGEVEYARRLGVRARAWVDANPEQFARLSALHLLHFYFPPGLTGSAAGVKWLIANLIALTGLLGTAAALIWWRGKWFYAAAGALAPVLPYVLIHSNARYRYLVLIPLIFLGIELCSRVAGRLSGRRPAASS